MVYPASYNQVLAGNMDISAQEQIRDLEGIVWALKCAAAYALDEDGYHLGTDVKQSLEDAVYRAKTYTDIYGTKTDAV